MSDREIRCRRRVNDGKDPCPWRGTRDDFPAHTDDTGHQACIVCRHPLADDETRACTRCVSRVSEDLGDIEDAYATLPGIIEQSGYRTGKLPGGDALVMAAGGSTQGGGPDDDIKFRDPIPVLAELHT